MKFSNMSINARGLNEPSAVEQLRHYLRRQNPTIDLLLIQETKLRNQAATQLGRMLWKGSRCWSVEASVGYTPNGRLAGRGAIATLLAAKWNKFVNASGEVMGNCASWFTLRGIPGGEIGFLNVYAPNDSLHRCVLWESLLRDLPRHCQWVIMGDFNMVEARADKSSLCGRMISGRERLLFNTLKTALQVAEPPREANGLNYTWDNFRFNGTRILARLDSATRSRQHVVKLFSVTRFMGTVPRQITIRYPYSYSLART